MTVGPLLICSVGDRGLFFSWGPATLDFDCVVYIPFFPAYPRPDLSFSPPSGIIRIDRDCAGRVFPVGFMIDVGKLQRDLVPPRFQVEGSLRLYIANVRV